MKIIRNSRRHCNFTMTLICAPTPQCYSHMAAYGNFTQTHAHVLYIIERWAFKHNVTINENTQSEQIVSIFFTDLTLVYTPFVSLGTVTNSKSYCVGFFSYPCLTRQFKDIQMDSEQTAGIIYSMCTACVVQACASRGFDNFKYRHEAGVKQSKRVDTSHVCI